MEPADGIEVHELLPVAHTVRKMWTSDDLFRSRRFDLPASALSKVRVPYRPDPIFDDSLEPDETGSVRGTIAVSAAALLALCFAVSIAVVLAVRTVFNAPYDLLRRILRRL